MKLGKQGEFNIRSEASAIVFVSNPTEINKTEEKVPFKGEIKVQPFMVKRIWEVFEGERPKLVIKSGANFLIFKYQPEKNRVRIRFSSDDSESSYIFFDNALNRLKDNFLSAIRSAGVVSIKDGDFSALRVGDKVILRNKNKEYFLLKDEVEKLKQFILKNYFIKKPTKMEGKIGIDENHNLIYKNLVIPKEHIRDLYLFIL